MGIKLRIKADNEHEFRRMLTTLASPFLADIVSELPDMGDNQPEPQPEPQKAKGGRPKGSTNKPKANGAEPPQTEPPSIEFPAADRRAAQAQTPAPNGSTFLSLAEQVQIITDAAHDQPDKLKPLLVPLREKLGVQYISKATEKDREVLQGFINEHGLAV
jgi:hypothetical protein